MLAIITELAHIFVKGSDETHQFGGYRLFSAHWSVCCLLEKVPIYNLNFMLRLSSTKSVSVRLEEGHLISKFPVSYKTVSIVYYCFVEYSNTSIFYLLFVTEFFFLF